MARCRELREDRHSDRLLPCGEPATEVRLRCPARRPDAVAAYCDEHGGEARARAEASLDWNYLAPESVGGPEDVEDAGCMQLQTPEAYVVVRQVPPEQGGKWLAWRGLGSMLTPVANPHGKRRSRGGKMLRYKDRPATSFPSREAALETAIAEWRRELAAKVDEITRARGGTLSWGSPVEPLAEPIVIVLEPGDGESNAWNVAKGLPRRSRGGVSVITGLRPSGECA